MTTTDETNDETSFNEEGECVTSSKLVQFSRVFTLLSVSFGSFPLFGFG